MKNVIFIFGLLGILSCNSSAESRIVNTNFTSEKSITKSQNPLLKDTIIIPIVKSEEEWEKELTKMEFHVLRNEGTERAFSGEYWNNKKSGEYRCAGCELPLFSSGTKFKSGTGWPSFYQPIMEGFIIENEDKQFGMVRVEVECARCKGHLGHVFNDGPKPTGLRYCINSASLKFTEKK